VEYGQCAVERSDCRWSAVEGSEAGVWHSICASDWVKLNCRVLVKINYKLLVECTKSAVLALWIIYTYG